MNNKIISYIQKKMCFKTKREVHDYLGIIAATGNKYDQKKDLNNSEVLNLLKKARKSAIQSSIEIITEYYPIKLTSLRSNHNFIDVKNNKNHLRLKNELEKNRGVYVFYDSSGKAIYVGKASRRSLYHEMISAFNRSRNETRDTMTIIRAQHTINKIKNIKFDKCIYRHRATISDISAYFSAYKIDQHLIPTVEALMIHAFANNLTNSKIEAL